MKVFLAWLAVLCLVGVQAGDEVHHLRGDSKATPAPKEEGTVAKESTAEEKEVPATVAVPKPEVGAVAKEPESAKGTDTETPQQTGKDAGVVVKEPAAKQPETVKPQATPAGVAEPEPSYYLTEDELEELEYLEWKEEQAYLADVDDLEDEEEMLEGPGSDEGVAVKELDPKAQAAAAAAAAPASLVRRWGRRPGRRPGRWGRRPGRWGRRPGRWGRRPIWRPRPYYRPGYCLRWAWGYAGRYCALWR